jgi:hypothetical protein
MVQTSNPATKQSRPIPALAPRPQEVSTRLYDHGLSAGLFPDASEGRKAFASP